MTEGAGAPSRIETAQQQAYQRALGRALSPIPQGQQYARTRAAAFATLAGAATRSTKFNARAARNAFMNEHMRSAFNQSTKSPR